MGILSRSEFEKLRAYGVMSMVADKDLLKDALALKVRAGSYLWVHQTNWKGEPCLQLPQDMFAIAEIIHETLPEIVIELGVAWAGSLLFYDDLVSRYGGSVLGVDRFVPQEVRDKLYVKRCSAKSKVIEADILSTDTIAEVHKRAKNRHVLLILDSDHTREHVLAELRAYSDLIQPGGYLVVCDTTIEYQPSQEYYRKRAWGKGNSPATAVAEFLKENHEFEVDWARSDKLLITNCIGGFLRRKQ